MVDLDVREPIDFITPVENLSGQRQLFITMLTRLEVMSLTSSIQQVAEGLNTKDWQKMKSGAHQLKGASGYVGAGRVHYCCYHIQNGFMLDDYQKMVEYYPLLIESCIEFKRFSRRYLANLESKLDFHFLIQNL